MLAETRENLAQSRARLPDWLRTARQMYGRQGNGCGATIGVMPRCDFACRGCYLGDEANAVPAMTVEEVKAQMRLLRSSLGNAGNLQLTDGEVTLRPADEVIELLRYAADLGLVPMLMSHGDTFRRRPGLIERFMVEGGLVEVSIHVDTTQRGRRGPEWRAVRTEAELNPLRDEFAEIVRRAKRATGLPLRCATTMTVTRENLDGVPDVMRWLARNGDAFRLISFQPVAQVGRTEAGLGAVTVDELWDRVADGLYDGAPEGRERLRRGAKWLGHVACNRFVHGLVARDGGAAPIFHPVREEGDLLDARVVDGFLDRFGGVTFRRDARLELVARLVALGARAPQYFARNLLPYARRWLARLSPGRPFLGAWRLLAGRLAVTPLVIVSHHFMSREELETSLGRERLGLCVFHVAVDGELVSMCETNALGVRDRVYAQLHTRRGARKPRAADTTPAIP